MTDAVMPGDRTVAQNGPDDDELARLGEAFADASRRDLFRRVMASAEPLSAGELAAATGLHRTVARSHLEKLVDLGLLSVSLRHTGCGGRPARVFSPARTVTSLSIPERRYLWLAQGLLRVLPAVANDAEALAAVVEEAGHREGRLLGASSPEAATQWLDRHGYGATLRDGPDGRVLELRGCVVAELAAVAPEIVCSYDRGFVRGLLGVPADSVEQLTSLAAGDDACRLRLRS